MVPGVRCSPRVPVAGLCRGDDSEDVATVSQPVQGSLSTIATLELGLWGMQKAVYGDRMQIDRRCLEHLGQAADLAERQARLRDDFELGDRGQPRLTIRDRSQFSGQPFLADAGVAESQGVLTSAVISAVTVNRPVWPAISVSRRYYAPGSSGKSASSSSWASTSVNAVAQGRMDGSDLSAATSHRG